MPTEKNKVKYNLKNVYYAVATIGATGAATYATPVAWPGAVSLSLSAEGEPTIFWADGIQYYVVNNNNGYSGDLETALIPDSFKTAILGEVTDANTVIVEDADAQLGHFALLFQFDGDQKATRHVLYNCTASRPNVESATKEENVEVKTETITIKARPVYNSDLEKYLVKGKADVGTNATVYEDWFEAVYQATDTAVSTTP